MSNLGNYGKTNDRERRLPEDRIGSDPSLGDETVGFDGFAGRSRPKMFSVGKSQKIREKTEGDANFELIFQGSTKVGVLRIIR